MDPAVKEIFLANGVKIGLIDVLEEIGQASINRLKTMRDPGKFELLIDHVIMKVTPIF